jgi:hypothetical protein
MLPLPPSPRPRHATLEVPLRLLQVQSNLNELISRNPRRLGRLVSVIPKLLTVLDANDEVGEDGGEDEEADDEGTVHLV